MYHFFCRNLWHLASTPELYVLIYEKNIYIYKQWHFIRDNANLAEIFSEELTDFRFRKDKHIFVRAKNPSLPEKT